MPQHIVAGSASAARAGTDAPPPGAARGSRARLLLAALRPYRGWVALVMAMMLVETLMSLAGPWPLKVVLDSVLGTHKAPAWIESLKWIAIDGGKLEVAAAAAIAVLVIQLINSAATYVDNYYTTSISQWVAHDFRMRVYEHLHRLSLGYYDTHQSGSILSTLTADIKVIQGFASSGVLSIVVDMLTIVGMLGLMFWLNWDFALIAVAVTPFLLLYVSRFNRAVKNATRDVRKRQSDIVSVVEQGLEEIRTTKAYGREDLEQQRLADASRASVQAALRARVAKSMLGPAVALTAAACTAYVLWRGANLVIAGAMTIGGLTVFLTYLSKFFKPVQDLAKMSSTIAQTLISVERIQAILDTDDILPQRANARDPGRLRGEITFEHLAFAYDPKAPVLRDVHTTIAAGQKVGIVGPTGGGKSTIVSMVPRFYDPAGGRVLIDGTDVRDFELAALRGNVGFVLQETMLFHGTILDNIGYGRPGATEAEVTEAARLANAHEFIERMPDGYNTLVGERGSTLSGGQRQRIGIARAILRNAPILILDEPTAALDTESEKLVMDALVTLMKGRTVLTIAHRLSTIRDADVILVLKDGVVAERGTHDELVALGGTYADLYRTQVGATPA
ncbi:MAG TPA: ABC transporter ATP-binding protein [Rubrivivax sp.]|nr:ABC transporter ATP-binding protein [Pseudomonadota bacterium]HOW48390.1 ABC transporter ATP-binding protein [Rubrivivax sp.]HRZ59654.1 ABC transporter ATP-binding protein [Rubrivivax sp.]